MTRTEVSAKPPKAPHRILIILGAFLPLFCACLIKNNIDKLRICETAHTAYHILFICRDLAAITSIAKEQLVF